MQIRRESLKHIAKRNRGGKIKPTLIPNNLVEEDDSESG